MNILHWAVIREFFGVDCSLFFIYITALHVCHRVGAIGSIHGKAVKRIEHLGHYPYNKITMPTDSLLLDDENPSLYRCM